MTRPIEALIHPAALAHNLAQARACAPHAKVWAVIKANAYGHGIERAFDGLRGADGLALLDLAEAERVRALGWRGPVLLLEGVFEPRDLELCSRLSLWHVVHCEQQIDWLARHKTRQGHRVFLKMNSGMNRLGFAPQAFGGAWTRLSALPQVDEISLMTHFSDADTDRDDASSLAHQLRTFERVTHDLPGERCLANSAALLRHAQAAAVRADWVRAGIVCYGSAPDHPLHDIRHWRLRPAMTLRSKLIATQQLQPGDTVGYGSTFVADAPLRIGIVACGYADGYPRHCPTGTPILVDGVRTRTIGRVSMDMLTVDLTPVPTAAFGSEVTLWGCGPAPTDPTGPGAPGTPGAATHSVLPIDEVARAGGTIGYELMCALAPRVPTRVEDAV
jgi:alanine racemase